MKQVFLFCVSLVLGGCPFMESGKGCPYKDTKGCPFKEGKGPCPYKDTPCPFKDKKYGEKQVSSTTIARVQSKAPQFSSAAVINGEISNVSLESYLGKWVVLIFYPMDFTFVCPTELCAFSDAIEQFSAIDTQILGISTDSEYAHLAWTNLPRGKGGIGKIKFPLVSDRGHSISRSYGVLLNDGVALRGMFIIDPAGVIRQMTVNDLDVGRSVDETLRLLKAFQFTKENGLVCPANWKEGDAGINPLSHEEL